VKDIKRDVVTVEAVVVVVEIGWDDSKAQAKQSRIDSVKGHCIGAAGVRSDNPHCTQ